MADRTIWHAIFEWFEDGVRHVAYRGEVVDIPQNVIDQYEKFGVFDAPAPVVDEDVDAESVTPVEITPDFDDFETSLAETADPEPVVDEPVAAEPTETKVPPKKTAPVKEWEDYAVDVGGIDREQAEALTKPDLIAKFGQ